MKTCRNEKLSTYEKKAYLGGQRTKTTKLDQLLQQKRQKERAFRVLVGQNLRSQLLLRKVANENVRAVTLAS